MAQNSIGKGALHLTTNTAQLQAGLDKAKSSISGFQLSISKGLSFFSTGPMGAILAGLSTFKSTVQEFGDQAEQILNQAEIFGVTAEKLQALQGAAGLAGVSVESLGKMLRMAGELAGEASLQSEEATKKLGLLGLNPQEFGKLGPAESLTQLLDALNKLPKGQQLKVAADIFGGRNSVDSLVLMRSELGKTTKEFEDMGATVDSKLLDRLDKLADMFAKNSILAKSFGMTMLAEVTKPLTGGMVTEDDLYNIDKLTKQITELYEASSKARIVANSPAGTFDSIMSQSQQKDMVNKVIEADNKLSVLESRLYIAQTRNAVQKMDEAEAAAEHLSESITQKMRDSFDALQGVIDDGWAKILESESKAADQFLKDPLGQSQAAINGLQTKFDEGVISMEQYRAGLARLASGLDSVKESSQEIKSPAAIMRGSSADASASIQDSAQMRFGDKGDSPIIRALKEQKDQQRQQGQDMLKKLGDIYDRLGPLEEAEAI